MTERQERMFVDLESLGEHVEKIAEKHEVAQRKSMEASRAVRDIEEAVKTKESMTLALVSGEQEPGTNKFKYTSAETRRAAAGVALVTDGEYQALKDRLFEQQGIKMNADLDLGGLEFQWKTASFVRDIKVAQTRLLTADPIQ